MTAKRGLFWYVDGELLCFPVSGDEADTVSNNHRRFWETLPHSRTCGMSYNYFPRGRVELRHGKAVVYLHLTLCTPEIDTRICHAFSLPDEMQVSFKADGSRHYRSIQEEQEGVFQVSGRAARLHQGADCRMQADGDAQCAGRLPSLRRNRGLGHSGQPGKRG